MTNPEVPQQPLAETVDVIDPVRRILSLFGKFQPFTLHLPEADASDATANTNIRP